jgi:hypothetical protein
MTLYTRGSFATPWGTYIIGKDTDNAKPWSVFLERDGRLYQAGKWYAYRGWAERELKKIKGDIA